MSDWKIYHNPKCSKSRQTLALLEENGIKAEVIEYLKTPLQQAELSELLGFLGLPPEKIVRVKESGYKEDAFDLSNEVLVTKKLAENPKLLERPIVVSGNRAVIGRPPENILQLL